MELFRIAQEQFADDLSGNGSRLFGGRWNSEGLYAVYTSSSRALALLETLAHTPAKMLDAKAYLLISIVLPDDLPVHEISVMDLAAGWDAPDTRPLTKKLGDHFLRNKTGLLLKVPSVVMPEESNFLLNPLHSDMKRIKIISKRKICFDKRVGENL
jgi:RES domain-containing protein